MIAQLTIQRERENVSKGDTPHNNRKKGCHVAGNNSSRSPVPKVRLKKRAGKAVTVISGLHTYGSDRLETIARELKSTLGAGGTVKNGIIEIQGDKVVRVKTWFLNRSA